MQYEIDLNENIEDLVLNAPKVFYFKTQIASVTVFHATERCSVKWIFFYYYCSHNIPSLLARNIYYRKQLLAEVSFKKLFLLFNSSVNRVSIIKKFNINHQSCYSVLFWRNQIPKGLRN